MKTLSVLQITQSLIEELNKEQIAICNYYTPQGELIQAIGLEYSDLYPQLPIVLVNINETGI